MGDVQIASRVAHNEVVISFDRAQPVTVGRIKSMAPYVDIHQDDPIPALPAIPPNAANPLGVPATEAIPATPALPGVPRLFTPKTPHLRVSETLEINIVENTEVY